MTTPDRTGWFSGRNRLVTIVSIAAVGAAGAIALSANIGLLDAAPIGNVGNVTAEELTTPGTNVVDVYLPPSTTTSATGTAAVQEFAVDAAGTVALVTTTDGIRLDSVSPAAGWTWKLSQTTSTDLMVTFTNGTRTLEFVATRATDGSIAASVTEPVITPSAPANGGSGHESDDDEYEGGGDDD